MTDAVRIRDDRGLRRLTLDRAEKMNALNTAMMRALTAAVEAAPNDGIELLVIEGAGERGFCVGGDVAEMRRGGTVFAEQEEALRALIVALHTAAVPVICLVHGRTLGAGCIIASLSDVVLAADNLHFGFPEMRFGLYPAFVHGAILERVSNAMAFQLCIGGRILSAAEALSFGFVTEVLSAEGFANHAAGRIAHYRERIDALVMGRRIRHMALPDSMAARMAELAPLLLENHEAPSARRLLAEMPFARPAGGA
ncbi:MAG TPA: enoyl-CoA hydratase/isomerase family protein [Azospirillum sp.]|nr:enoyl-CoA hydratase/isomerase family protein [Azospirillum sp.]